MTISYKWLSDYLPVTVEPERLGRILTSIGLEVESMQPYEELKGNLLGLVIGEVVSTEKHPNADKLTLTRVNVGDAELQIVCGAPNVAKGQKVVVAPPGATIYPIEKDPLTMKVARIRGVESYGMICAEDEIGLGTSHEGILVLPDTAKPGTAAAEFFQPYNDIIIDIGLTPNRMDAMSHWGVARDVCAYLSHHDKKDHKARIPVINGFKADDQSVPITVTVEDTAACPRYSGVSLGGVQIGPSPKWMQQRLKAIGVRPINNIVDITNYLLHETGQPLHAFDADRIAGRQIIVKKMPAGTKFVTLDEKERTLDSEDLMICDAQGGACIAGVFGGVHSGVSDSTKNIFLESACFDPLVTRKTSFRHGLRTEAASRFEKGTDISQTVTVLKRAAQMMRELAGARVSSDIIDVYPDPRPRTEVAIKYHYLKKLSGKSYHPDTLKNILSSLGFEIVKERIDELWVSAPYSKPDISLPADLVEEIIRIDGLDNIEIPQSISITPSVEEFEFEEGMAEKISGVLSGLGFHEIMTNSITNAGYYPEEEQAQMVKMLNSLSAEHNVMRSSLFETAMEVVAHNLNHRNLSLRLFEFGKGYGTDGPGEYRENRQLCLVVSGPVREAGWKQKETQADLYYLKGVLDHLWVQMGIVPDETAALDVPRLKDHLVYRKNGRILAGLGEVKKDSLSVFGIRQPVFFAGLDWDAVMSLAAGPTLKVTEPPRFPAVQLDLAMIIDRSTSWEKVEQVVQKIRLNNLRDVKLFDIFESDKLGPGKKSFAVNFTFRDEEKTLTDKEIDAWMHQIMNALETGLSAEIRK